MPIKIKVLLVDDHPLVRDGLASLINQQEDLEICGEADNEAQALELIGAVLPDVAIVDVMLKNGSGIELIKRIKAIYPAVVPLVLSMHEEDIYAERALRAGARGYIMKCEVAKKVIQGIRCVQAGQLFVSEKIAALLAGKFVKGRADMTVSPIEQLSSRELEVLQLLGRGCTTRQIADHLQVGFKTVQTYSARIKEKLKLATATELLREAMRWQDGQSSK